jgi:ureidoacrylate peracid hydrolase
VADRIGQFLPAIRGKVSLIAFFKLTYDPAKLSVSQRERLLREGKPVICAPGTPGVDLFLVPAEGDHVFTKYRYSAFTSEAFREVLRDLAIDTVAVAGVDTHICVEGTVRNGYDLGYRMVVLEDLVATRKSEEARHDSSLQLCERYFATVIESSAFLHAVDRSTTLMSGPPSL